MSKQFRASERRLLLSMGKASIFLGFSCLLLPSGRRTFLATPLPPEVKQTPLQVVARWTVFLGRGAVHTSNGAVQSRGLSHTYIDRHLGWLYRGCILFLNSTESLTQHPRFCILVVDMYVHVYFSMVRLSPSWKILSRF
jgi:hypothetical protein